MTVIDSSERLDSLVSVYKIVETGDKLLDEIIILSTAFMKLKQKFAYNDPVGQRLEEQTFSSLKSKTEEFVRCIIRVFHLNINVFSDAEWEKINLRLRRVLEKLTSNPKGFYDVFEINEALLGGMSSGDISTTLDFRLMKQELASLQKFLRIRISAVSKQKEQ